MSEATSTGERDPRIEQRIAQFENMTNADPENEMAHFSLGNAYLQAGRAAEAAGSFEKVMELNPEASSPICSVAGRPKTRTHPKQCALSRNDGRYIWEAN